MTNVTNLATHDSLPTAAPQQSGNTITMQQALASGISPNILLAVANWNERESHNQRRRKARARLKHQAIALREVAGDLASVQQQASYGLQEAA